MYPSFAQPSSSTQLTPTSTLPYHTIYPHTIHTCTSITPTNYLSTSWDNLYNLELTNHTLDSTDIGTIWFDDSSAEDKVVDFLNESIIDESLLGPEHTRENISILDLGTGNGHFLIRLRAGEEDEDEEKKWTCRLMGVDYSEKSIEFARRIAADGKEEGEEREIEWVKWDIMKEAPKPEVLNGEQENGWDIVVDKGTFDAISLSEERDAEGKRICEGYRERVLGLVRRGGVAVVTSCNWTEGELIGWFLGEEGERSEKGWFKVERKIEYRSFSFGGVKGQTVCSVCFRKYGGSF